MLTERTYLETQLLMGWRLTWINQPSKLQRHHSLNGTEVYAKPSDYVRDGEQYSSIVYISKPKCKGILPTLVPNRSLANGPKRKRST